MEAKLAGCPFGCSTDPPALVILLRAWAAEEDTVDRLLTLRVSSTSTRYEHEGEGITHSLEVCAQPESGFTT
jgi:hypothetical protein